LDAQQAALQDGESEYESENVLLSELIDEHGGDLNPDENLLEGMCIAKAMTMILDLTLKYNHHQFIAKFNVIFFQIIIFMNFITIYFIHIAVVWVKSATVRDGVVGPGASTFVVIDFFDYESQTTSLLTGNS
jgi:hypothetical protein